MFRNKTDNFNTANKYRELLLKTYLLKEWSYTTDVQLYVSSCFAQGQVNTIPKYRAMLLKTQLQNFAHLSIETIKVNQGNQSV